MKVRLGVTRSANEGPEMWCQVLEKSVGWPFLSLDDIGDVSLEMKGGEQKKSGWDTDIYRMHVQETGLKNPHSERDQVGYSVSRAE